MCLLPKWFQFSLTGIPWVFLGFPGFPWIFQSHWALRECPIDLSRPTTNHTAPHVGAEQYVSGEVVAGWIGGSSQRKLMVSPPTCNLALVFAVFLPQENLQKMEGDDESVKAFQVVRCATCEYSCNYLEHLKASSGHLFSRACLPRELT